MEELYRHQWAPLVRLAYFLTGNRPMAEDVVQDAFVRLDGRRRFPERPEAYLRMTVVNLVRDRRRRAVVERRHLLPPPEPVLNPELDELWGHLWALPARERQALVLRFYADLPVAEVASLLHCPEGTAKSLIHRGILGLRAHAGVGR